MATYQVIYRDQAGNDSPTFTAFEDGETIEENLARIIPRAIARGLLHPEAAPDKVVVEHNHVKLNLKLNIREAAAGIKEQDDIVVRYVASKINLRMRFWGDDPADQRRVMFRKRKTVAVNETAVVNPAEKFSIEIEGKLNEIKGKYKFFGKKIKTLKRFRFHTGSKKINVNQSLTDQGIEEDIEVDIRPRVWFDWPARFWNGFGGPYTAHAITLGVLVPLLALVLFLFGTTVIEGFEVTFESDYECKIRIGDSSELLDLKDNRLVRHLGAGEYVVHIFPKERPIVDQTVLLEKTVRGFVKSEDSLVTINLQPVAPVDSARALVTIVGYLGEAAVPTVINVDYELLINGFTYSHQLSHRKQLFVGNYEIKFNTDDSEFREVVSRGGMSHEGDFRFRVNGAESGTGLTFYYGER
ncbi:MAG: hypothetical protein V3V49_00590 [Candidatus Krumholzibacteria bacterium]